MKFKKDTRAPFWKKTELNIQKRALKKDKGFVLSGSWKKYVRTQEGVKIFRVDSEWIRNNLLNWWNHGGHGYVCEFIPANEIWVGHTHPVDCSCKCVRKDRKISERYFESTVYHEFTERALMKKGMIYWKAHQIAVEKERELGLLKNAYDEDYSPIKKR
jgi:hypothetical protein